MYDADNPPALNLREWLAARHIILISIRDENDVWVRNDLDGPEVDRLQCEFENAELEHARQHALRTVRGQCPMQHFATNWETRVVDRDTCIAGIFCECTCVACMDEPSGLFYCTVEEGIPDCPGHRLEYEYCPGARQPLRCPENDPECDDQACPEHPRHLDGEHTYEQHHSPVDHVGGLRCFCHG